MTTTTNAAPIQGIRADSRIPKPKRYPEGRVCVHEGCETVLHRYNPNQTCDPHTLPKRRPRVEGRA